MRNEVFQFHIQALACGWCYGDMLINGKTIHFEVGYLGDNPLASLIDACLELIIDAENNYFEPYYITWYTEPDLFEIELNLNEKNQLHLDIKEQDEDKGTIYGEWHEDIPFNVFVSSIVSEGFRILNAYGLYGYRCSWSDRSDFPLSSLLRISGKTKGELVGDSYLSDISNEIANLQEIIERERFTEEKWIYKCAIYYESQQFVCADDAFAVGDEIEWTCALPKKYKNTQGMIIDLEKVHREIATHNVKGKVVTILAERSEFPKGEKEECYDMAPTETEEIQRADGLEKDLKNCDTTDGIFWGYFVELTEVIIRPIE